MTLMMPSLTVEVFNADYRSFGEVSWMDAIRLILRDAVHIVESHTPSIHVHAPSRTVELPVSVVLKRYAHRPYVATDTSRATRAGVLRRDKNTCIYCGDKAATWDHILPKSRGGAEVWVNMAAACSPCNGLKGDRTPEEAGMRLLWEPYVPRERDRFAALM